MMDIKGAIFDLDGTLLDSMHIWDDIGSRFLLRHGITPPPGLNDAIVKMTLPQSADYFIQQFHLSMPPFSIMKEINCMVEDDYAHHVPLKPFVRPLLEQLAKNKIPMCIATVTDRPLVELAFKRLGIHPYFQFILTCADVGKGKQEPDIYLQAAAQLGTAPCETMVYEDSLHCIETAKRAGFCTTGVYDRSSLANQQQIQQISDFYIKDV